MEPPTQYELSESSDLYADVNHGIIAEFKKLSDVDDVESLIQLINGSLLCVTDGNCALSTGHTTRAHGRTLVHDRGSSEDWTCWT